MTNQISEFEFDQWAAYQDQTGLQARVADRPTYRVGVIALFADYRPASMCGPGLLFLKPRNDQGLLPGTWEMGLISVISVRIL
jgi:hypothetical protein